MNRSALIGMRSEALSALGKRDLRRQGTTLVELLVVIVIFLVGILAILNVFPRGIRLLSLQRNSSIAEALARSEVERLRTRSDQLPERIAAVQRINGVVVEDPTRDPSNLGPLGTSILPNGTLVGANGPVGDWLLNSGANSARRVIHEPHKISQVSQVGNEVGNLVLVNFGPSDSDVGMVAVANALNRLPSSPRDLRPRTGPFSGSFPRPSGAPIAVDMTLVDSTDRTGPFEYSLVNGNTPQGFILLPTTNLDRSYLMDVSIYVRRGANVRRLDLRDVRIFVPANTTAPLVGIPFSSITVGLTGLNVIEAGDIVVGIETDSLSIAPEFVQIANDVDFANFPGDPFRFKVLDPSMGVALFSPFANQYRIQRAGGLREAIEARISYDVADWRILREEFRLTEDGAGQIRFRLGVGPLKIGGQAGPDGRALGGISYETVSPPALEAIVNSPRADHFVLLDMATGGVICERDAGGNERLIVDKSTGLVTILPTGAGMQVRLPAGRGLTSVPALGRAVRALYMARNEWTVQVSKSASEYQILNDAVFQIPNNGQASMAGTRLYFAASEAGKRVTIDTINYLRNGDTQVHVLHNADFVIRRIAGDPVGLPAIDVRDVAPDANGMDVRFGTPMRGVKGSSATVRVLWNPDSTQLTGDPVANLERANVWGRGWRRSNHETYIQKESAR